MSKQSDPAGGDQVATPMIRATPMTRAGFLKFAAGAGGLLAGAGVLGPLGRAIAADSPAPGPLLSRPIPSSGEMLPVIGIGTAVVYDIALDDPKLPVLVETVRTFFANGGKMIDTAPTYGRAERTTGEILRRLGQRDRAFVATKISITGEQAGVDQVARSVRDLGTERFELLQVHNIRDTAVHLKTIRAMRDQGRVRYVGITTSFDNAYPEYERIMRAEKLDFIQIDYALDNRNADDRILPLARELGMAVMINLPFGRGRLFNKARGRELPEFAKEFDCISWAQFFLKFILANPAVTAVIPGTDRPEYAIDNLNAGRGRLPDAAMRQRIIAYWDKLG